jgi:hypothetical protein
MPAAGHPDADLRLGANLEVDVLGRRLGIVGGLGASLDVGRDAVVVARREQVEVVQALERDGVLGRAEADSGGITGHLTLSDVVRRLSTKEEAITADDGVSGKGRALEICYQCKPENDASAARTLKRSRKARVCRPGCL